jgi:hypothetical protein
MNRGVFFALLTAGVLTTTGLSAQLPVAPAPREIRPDGSRDPAPQASTVKKENPLEVVERIIKNSKAVSDKLAMTDTGTETRTTQDKILKDIQSLIDQQDTPPPSPDQNPDKNDKSQDKDQKDQKDKQAESKDQKTDMPPMKKDMGGMSPMGNPEDEPHVRQPRQQDGKQSGQKKGQPMGASGKKPQPMPNTQNEPPKNPKNTGGVVPDPSKGNPTDPGRPLLPMEEEIIKEVWGHLPDKMRQQATQYYQQDFMPRYTELLKLYYSSLAEKSERK